MREKEKIIHLKEVYKHHQHFFIFTHLKNISRENDSYHSIVVIHVFTFDEL